MALMEDQAFSRTFRRRQPAFNGLIWAYHWLQVGLYEPLVRARTPAEAKGGVAAAVGRFWRMVASEQYPRVMPMTAAVAPEFSRRHPRAAAIFDNLHMMHDIISDVLAAPGIPRERKREVIAAQLAEFRSAGPQRADDRRVARHAGADGRRGRDGRRLFRVPRRRTARHTLHRRWSTITTEPGLTLDRGSTL